jgi:hypothetical protein
MASFGGTTRRQGCTSTAVDGKGMAVDGDAVGSGMAFSFGGVVV